MIKGQIIKSTGGLYTVITPEGDIWETRPRGLFRKTGHTPYVGDFVQVDPAEGNSGTIVEIEKRKNSLVRPPVANLDFMVSVVAASDPVPNYVVIDKFLAVMESENIPTIVVVTKLDLASPDPIVAIYENAGYKALAVNNLTGEGIPELREALGSGLCAFSGNTGTGKSSVLNALDPELDLETGETSKKLGRGRHTTRHVEIFALNGGLRVADTPGFSSMDLVQAAGITGENLTDLFIDIREYSPNCKFRDCAHHKEIGCAVRQAVEDGDIEKTRYESYLTIYDEIKDVREWQIR